MLLNMLKGCCNDAVMNITPQNNYNFQGVSTLLLLALDREFNYCGVSIAGRRKPRIDATEARTLPFQNGMLPVGSADDMLLPTSSVMASYRRRRRGLQRPL
jgi:hypothetical protein